MMFPRKMKVLFRTQFPMSTREESQNHETYHGTGFVPLLAAVFGLRLLPQWR